MEDQRETILDRRVHIEAQMQEIPQVPPLCDELKVEKRRINVGDCEIYCETEGRGIPIVLINGGPGGTHHGFHSSFGKAASFAEVVYYDQRGCGRSDYKPGPGYTIEQAVNDLDKLREALKIERWTVLGWSYGGALAQLYTLKHPEHTAGLVLVGATDAGFHLQLQAAREYDYFSPEEKRRVAEIRRDRSLSEDKLVYNIHLNGDWKRQSFHRPTQEDLARLVLYGWKHDPAFRESICQGLEELHFGRLFEGCPVPTLVLEGKYDLTWGTDKAEKFHAGHPGSKLVMFERSGHGPFMDEPDKFFSVLQEFMKALPETSTAGVAKWKKNVADCVADRSKRLAAEAANPSDRIAFHTKAMAPPEFDAWTLFWLYPTVAKGASIGYEVRSAGGQVWHRHALALASPGERIRSDFSKNNGDLRKLQGKQIVITFWTSQGKIEFPAGMKPTFEFRKNGQTIKTIDGIREDR